MADETLRYETGTDEEMNRSDVEDMQKKWLEADDKFNFIIWDVTKDCPIGDIGLFYNGRTETSQVSYTEGEISMMVAETEYRRQGIGALALLAVAKWSKDSLGTREIVAKIKDSNLASRTFFEKHAFVFESHSPAFEEVTLRYSARD